MKLSDIVAGVSRTKAIGALALAHGLIDWVQGAIQWQRQTGPVPFAVSCMVLITIILAKEWMRQLAVLGLAALISAPAAAASDMKADVPALPAAHGKSKLDLDIYTWGKIPPRSPADAAGTPLQGWIPGDPRAERGEPTWVKHVSHVGYAGLDAVGLAASIASGGVAPAIGFGIVAVVQSFLEWRQIKNPSSGKSG